ncbi:Nucleolar RNA helicase 2 [Echinococcus granulosus]|uniref:DEAD Asp Glu Ala Asp box polypeptide 21 n=1 Tax=Echinococcus granulosus TaxID=6210 RepID=A0A068WPD9_ECHGR|nr:Nucleolar RNA helicase 2 [Echinococcus granulosus]CDS21989.1 DEAD Asp Glu Ala Asp box polypeptide 21 [Echinococcus granulosus]
METSDLSEFNISDGTLAKLKSAGITSLYKVQAETYEHIKNGDDVVTLAKTGSGKTLAFSIPIIERIKENGQQFTHGRHPVAIVLAPTRELVVQTASVLSSIAPEKLVVLSVYGGVAYQPQIRSLKAGVDIVVGAPGRIIDLMSNNHLQLDGIQYVVLDEVDRMLDMGFSADVEKILSQVYESEKKPQTLLFSATLPKWVSEISKKYVSSNCKQITLVSKEEARTADTVEHLAILCPYYERANALADTIRVYSKGSSSRCIVFCEKKKDADELAAHSAMASDCHVFHGDIPQEKRELILQKFREGKYKTLLTTNVAARGLDIPDVELVIQCAPPFTAEDYIHRSGRTGRAGRCGTSICFYTMKQRQNLAFIERGAGIVFKRISAPTPSDIVDVWASELSQTFSEIPESTWSTFLPAARRLVKSTVSQTNTGVSKKPKKSKKSKTDDSKEPEKVQNGHSDIPVSTYEKALCCALAKIAGKLKTMESRSILSAHADLTAFRLGLPHHMTAHRKGFCYSLLTKQLDSEITESIRNLAIIKGRKGFVFDVPDDKVEAIESTWVNGNNGIVLEKLTELPELEPEMDELNGNYGHGDGFRSGGFRSRGGAGRGFGGGNHRGGRGLHTNNGRGGGFAKGGRGFTRERGTLRGGMKRRQSSQSTFQRPAKIKKSD